MQVFFLTYSIFTTIFCIVLLYLHLRNRRCIKVISIEYLEDRISVLEKKLGLIKQETKNVLQ